jgi:transcriptional regulator with XRE-family HTH domain
MAQTKPLVDTLKRALKAHARTYADVAKHLGLTEASVKRLFSERSFSLQRLDQVCQLIGMEISDLVQMMREETQKPISELTEEQEQEIVGDLELLLVALCVLNRWTMSDILSQYGMPESRCIRHLAKLDRLKIIELLPRNRVKLLVAHNFSWRANGPIQRFFQEKVQGSFFRSRFEAESDKLLVINVMLSSSSYSVLQRRLERVARELDALADDDAGTPVREKQWTTVVLAARQWQYGPFERLRKKSAKEW